MELTLQVIPKNLMPLVQVIEMPNKSVLVKAYENPRISQYPAEIRNTNTLNFIDWCLNLLAVNAKEGQEFHHAACFDFINSSLTKYTYQELQQAILLYVKGEYEDMMVVQTFNAVILGKIMQRYDEIRSLALNNYLKIKNQKTLEKFSLTQEEKKELVLQGVLNCYETWKESGSVVDGYVWVYDFFVEDLKILSPTAKEKKRIYEIAKRVLKNNYKNGVDAYARNLLKEIQQKQSAPVISKSKMILLDKFFKNLSLKKSNINHYLSKLINEFYNQNQ